MKPNTSLVNPKVPLFVMITGLIAILKVFVAANPLLPTARTAKVVFVERLGVPLITPFVHKLKPAGKPPETIDHM